jgi:hypothetical protein
MPGAPYAVVRYRLNALRADDVRVEPDGGHTWHYTDNIKSALAAAQKFYEEKQRLIQEAEAHIRTAIDNIGNS